MSAQAPPPPPGDGESGGESRERSPTTDELDALGPALVDALDRVMGVLRRQGRKKVGELARRGRERLDHFQARRDLDRLYQKLGREVLRLVEAGELDHPALHDRARRIRQQQQLVAEAEAAAGVPLSGGDPDADELGPVEVNDESGA